MSVGSAPPLIREIQSLNRDCSYVKLSKSTYHSFQTKMLSGCAWTCPWNDCVKPGAVLWLDIGMGSDDAFKIKALHRKSLSLVMLWGQILVEKKNNHCLHKESCFDQVSFVSSFIRIIKTWVWWSIRIILVLGRLRQEDGYEFELNLQNEVESILK